jgi:hypothetical protein
MQYLYSMAYLFRNHAWTTLDNVYICIPSPALRIWQECSISLKVKTASGNLGRYSIYLTLFVSILRDSVVLFSALFHDAFSHSFVVNCKIGLHFGRFSPNSPGNPDLDLHSLSMYARVSLGYPLPIETTNEILKLNLGTNFQIIFCLFVKID